MAENHPIVGVWHVRISGAPFEHHMMTFHADGTMVQSNPDAGNASTSDSAGMGPWQANGDTVKAIFVEITADRQTHAFVSLGSIALDITVDRDALAGRATATFYDEQETEIDSSTHDVTGYRITL